MVGNIMPLVFLLFLISVSHLVLFILYAFL